MLEIRHRERDERDHKDDRDGEFEAQSETIRGEREKRPRRRLDERIPDGYANPAIPALSAEDEVRKHRHIVERGDGRAALRAFRPRPRDRLAEWNPVYDDVQKAPDDESEKSGDERQQTRASTPEEPSKDENPASQTRPSKVRGIPPLMRNTRRDANVGAYPPSRTSVPARTPAVKPGEARIGAPRKATEARAPAPKPSRSRAAANSTPARASFRKPPRALRIGGFRRRKPGNTSRRMPRPFLEPGTPFVGRRHVEEIIWNPGGRRVRHPVLRRFHSARRETRTEFGWTLRVFGARPGRLRGGVGIPPTIWVPLHTGETPASPRHRRVSAIIRGIGRGTVFSRISYHGEVHETSPFSPMEGVEVAPGLSEHALRGIVALFARVSRKNRENLEGSESRKRESENSIRDPRSFRLPTMTATEPFARIPHERFPAESTIREEHLFLKPGMRKPRYVRVPMSAPRLETPAEFRIPYPP